MIRLILLVLALVCFIVSALGWSSGRVNLVAAGLAFLTGYFLTAGVE